MIHNILSNIWKSSASCPSRFCDMNVPRREWEWEWLEVFLLL